MFSVKACSPEIHSRLDAIVMEIIMRNLARPFFPVALDPDIKRDGALLAPLFAFLGELAVVAAICCALFLAVFGAFSALGFGIHVLSLVGLG